MQVAEETDEVLAENDQHALFEDLVRTLRDLDAHTFWEDSEARDRRHLVEEMVAGLSVFPDHLEVTVTGATTFNILYGEIGMKGSDCWCRRADVNNPTGA
ncbi:MAG TPA: hypothetical protein VMU68_02035 [Acidimicrobiales bacterium]|nr:hypothetical protein [Acidimicrobiales bacterium]